ncbi:MAG: DUF1028 domain-containing protein [Solirubrobacteraceae bacterium]
MTYSIVARDPDTGELGVAVQSHWFSVGAVVPWARPGVGAVATQANAEIAYGPRALELLDRGATARQALDALLMPDPLAQSRQVAVVDAAGRVAAHTGRDCIEFAGDIQGAGFSCQANIMTTAAVWPAMLQAFQAGEGPLSTRLMTALNVGESAGGDLRGRQSAALLVVPAAGEPWEESISLRVEDHPDPLVELARLARLHDAYTLAGQGDELLAAARHQEAAQAFMRALELAPESDELRFWAGLGAAQAGDMDAALAHVRAAIEAHAGFQELLRRLPASLGPAAAAMRERLGSASGAGT